jgi:phospholipase/carboxylesterase
VEETLKPRRVEIAGLPTIEFPAPEGAPTIVVFHGYGADGADLAPMALELALPRPARWLFPDAPLTLDWGGRAWFAIDVASIELAQRTGKAVDWSESSPEALGEARSAAGAFVEALRVPWQKLILGGFSQGSMLAVDLALRAPEPPRGLAILSGNLINAKAWRELAPRWRGMPFFQSHGSADPILGFSGALKLESLLKDAGLEGSLLRFEGGHGIGPEAAAGLRDFLARLV